MVERTYERHFRALHKREITFDEFERETKHLWRRIAGQMHRRWKLPAWFTEEETVQNLLFAAWEFTPRFDARRGKSIQRYVVWNAYDKAKKLIHVARNANRSGNADSAQSRIERVLSSYGEDSGGDEEVYVVEHMMHARGAFTAPGQEESLITAEDRMAAGARAWSFAESLSEMRVLEALTSADSAEDAAKLLWDDTGARFELELSDLDEAERVVAKTVRAVAKRFTRAA